MCLSDTSLSCARLYLTLSTDPAQGTSETQPKKATNEPNTHGITAADKIRYGQSIQEGGMGGKTTSSTGQANNEGTSLRGWACASARTVGV